jgi:hypothetical protein
MGVTTSDTRHRIRDEDLPELLRLLRGADSCELKLSIPSQNQRATIKGLPLDPVEAQPRQVFFFDTPNLDLNKAGVVVRARRIQGGRGDTVVKLRPVVPSELAPEVRKSGSLNVEVDVIPGGFVCSAALKAKATGDQIRDAVQGGSPIRKLFTKEQRDFYASRAPDGISLDGLSVLGPTFVLKGQFTPPELGRRMVAELWFYPDGSRVLELSTKALPDEAFGVAVETRAYLSGHGVTIGGAQQTKTRAALDFFSAELKRPARRPAARRTTTARRRTAAAATR